jgi:hypothetical protein
MTMTGAYLLPAAVLNIRQAIPRQVQTNFEIQQREYELSDVARERGSRHRADR